MNDTAKFTDPVTGSAACDIVKRDFRNFIFNGLEESVAIEKIAFIEKVPAQFVREVILA